MSLVNDMLNDLEQRRSKAPAVDVSWMSAATTGAGRQSKRPLIIILVLVTIALLAAVVWKYWQIAAIGKGEVRQPPPLENKLAAAVVPKLQGLTWHREKEITLLEWQLSEIKPYSIRRTGAGLELQFFDTENQLSVSVLKPEPPVQTIAVQQRAQDTVVTLGIDEKFNFSDRLSKKRDNVVELQLQTIEPSREKVDSKERQPVLAVESSKAVSAETEVEKKPEPEKARVSKQEPGLVSQLTVSQQDMQLVQRAKKLLQTGDSYQAQQLLQPFVEQEPAAIRSGKLLASIWLSQQQLAQAGTLLEAMLVKNSADIDLRILKARLLMAQNDYAAAVDWLMQATPALRQHQDYYELLGFAARQNRQYVLSEQAYKGLLDSNADRGDWWVGMAIALDAQGKLAAARSAYQQALVASSISLPLKQYAQQRLTTLN